MKTKTNNFNLGNVLEICQGPQIPMLRVSFALQVQVTIGSSKRIALWKILCLLEFGILLLS